MSGGERSDTEVTVIVGLGNPGDRYEGTRHNAGFMVLDRLAACYGAQLAVKKFEAAWGTAFAEGRKVSFIKPLTYMNRSGYAVREILHYYNLPMDGVLVVHDELDILCGRMKITRQGGAGGHKGVASIMEQLGQKGFPRLKLGIGKPEHGEPVETFVLAKPYPEQREVFAKMIDTGVEAAQAVLKSGLSAAMNQFNRREL